MKKILLLILVCQIYYNICNAQNFNSNTLYLKLDLSTNEQFTSVWVTRGSKQEKVYFYNYMPTEFTSYLQFYATDRSQSQTLSLNVIGNYPIKTLEELKTYLNTLTPRQIVDYLSGVQNYYIVEFIGNNQIYIVPVKLDMTADF